MSNVSVCVRFRPHNTRESLQAPGAACIRKLDNECVMFQDEKDQEETTFTFDRIFYEDSVQADVFDFVALPIVRDAMNAINGTVLTYGQTGAGKTHSMEGPSIQTNDPELKGILPRVTQIIFDYVARTDETIEFLIKLSMVEIYMEKIRDLLDTKKDNLQVKENKLHGIFVAGVTEKYVQSQKEMLQILQTGLANRAVGQTLMNCESSRSHCVFLLTIQQTDIEDRSIKTGKIYLVDLAGSEKVEKTGAEGKLLCEAKTINKSLSALGNVINALTSDKQCHVPYRDSKLTRILQDSLGGNSRTALLCCCSPSTLQASETLSTLRFGTRAKLIKNKPKVNSERGRHELEFLLQKSYQECDQLRAQLLMSSARLRSLNQVMSFDGEANVKDDTYPFKLHDKLINEFPTHIPATTGDIIELHKKTFVEILLEENFDKTQFCDLTDHKYDEERFAQDQLHQHLTEEKVYLFAQDDTAKTIRVLQDSIEQLMDENSELEKLNKGLELELFACMRLLHDPPESSGQFTSMSAAADVKWPTITTSVHGGTHDNYRPAVHFQFKLLNMIDSASVCSLWRSSLTMVRNIIGQVRRA